MEKKGRGQKEVGVVDSNFSTNIFNKTNKLTFANKKKHLSLKYIKDY